MTVNLPTGTVSFLFTDIEGSTRLWEQHPAAMQAALARHDALLRNLITSHGGLVIKSTGDGLYAVFAHAAECVAAALACQQALAHEAWPNLPRPLSVRMGLHSGEAEVRDADYFGSTLNRTARLMSIASGGQVLLSAATTELVRDQMPQGAILQDLGEQRLKDLSRPEHVFQLSGSGLPDTFPPLRLLNTLPNNPYRAGSLPAQLTSFVGRESELVELSAILSTNRLVTLTGPGGAGKTRLAQAVAAARLDGYTAGVWLVELAPISNPTLVPATVAAVFDLHPTSQSAEALLAKYLHDSQALLILDNCEHLIGACAELAEALLRSCPRLQILATSREALGVPGEVIWRVPSMLTGEAIRLFVERARTAKPGFALTEQNTATITRICERLDGIPLAIELAAARLRTFSVEQVASRLDDRFHLLTGGSRTALPRHQTLRATVDWSYELLTGDEQRLLRWLAVFAGGWNVEAVEGIWGNAEVLELLDQLVNKSMVLVNDGNNNAAEPRYHQLETIRQYASEKLEEADERDQAHRRHAEYFAGMAQRAKPHLRGPQQYAWFDQLEADLDNLRAALEWTVRSGAWQTAERIIDGIWWFLYRYFHKEEALRWIDANLLQPTEVGTHARTLGRTLWEFLHGTTLNADVSKVKASIQENLEIAKDVGDEWMILWTERMLAFLNPNLEQRITQFREVIEHARRLGWIWEEAMTLGFLSWSLAEVDLSQAEDAVTRALQLNIGLGDRSHIGWLQRELAGLAMRRGDYPTARRHLEESIDTYNGTRDFGLVDGLTQLAGVAIIQGDIPTAKECLKTCLPMNSHRENELQDNECLVYAACVAQADSRHQAAIRILSSVAAYFQSRGQTPLNSDIDKTVSYRALSLYERCLSALRADADAVMFEREWTIGQQMSLQQAAALVLTGLKE